MGMFTSLNNAITSTFDVVTSVAETAEETVSAGTHMVKRRAQALQITDKQYVAVNTAEKMLDIQKKLQSDADLTKLYDQVLAELN